MPAANPLTSWDPLAAVLGVRFGPDTETDVALLDDHVIVAAPGAATLPGLALIAAVTFPPEVSESPRVAEPIVTSTVLVTGPPFPCAVIE